MAETIKMHFSIEGEYITNLARERLFIHKNLNGAIELLRSCLMSDNISSDEQLMLCLQILHGAATITGNSDSDDYGVEFRDDMETRPTNLSAISQLITDMNEQIERLSRENRFLMDKFAYAVHGMDNIKLEKINADYYNETGEPLFDDIPVPDWRKNENQLSNIETGMLESYLAQRERERDAAKNEEELPEDYGWLEPDGTFHPVPWGHHAEWAKEWLEEHMPFKDNPSIYWYTDKKGVRHHIVNGDVLIYSLNWILLDNPYQGLAKVTRNTRKYMTKAQKEFLYDYFIKRNRHKEANALYAESED